MAVNGNNIFITIGEGTTATIIAGTRSNDIQTQAEMIPISSPASGQWKEVLAGQMDWGFSTNFLLLSDSSVLDLLKVGLKVTVNVVTRQGSVLTVQLTGQAYFKTCRITSTRGNLAQGGFQLQGTGPLAVPDLVS